MDSAVTTTIISILLLIVFFTSLNGGLHSRPPEWLFA
jgi:hypothetical protein